MWRRHVTSTTQIRPEVQGRSARIVGATRRPNSEVARELGISAGILGNWVRKDRTERGRGRGLERRRPSRAGAAAQAPPHPLRTCTRGACWASPRPTPTRPRRSPARRSTLPRPPATAASQGRSSTPPRAPSTPQAPSRKPSDASGLQSMGHVRWVLNNACPESFFSTPQHELVSPHRSRTRDQARTSTAA